MESSDTKGFFGLPISQAQPNYVYVPSATSNTTHNVVEHSATFILDPQQMTKMPSNVMTMAKRGEGMSAAEVSSNFSPMHQLPPLELSLQPTVTLTETSSMIPIQQNFQIVTTQQSKLFPQVIPNTSYTDQSMQKNFENNGTDAELGQASIPDVKIEEKDTLSPPSEELSRTSQIRSFITDVKEGPVAWKAVRSKVLSQCRLWDILVDKVDYDYMAETLSCKLPQDKHRKFRRVVKELEELLGEFKCFMDGCVEEDKENICQFTLGPELCRAYEILPNKSWILKDESDINSFYRPFFENIIDIDNNNAENEEEQEPDEDLNDNNSCSDEQLQLQDFKPQVCCISCSYLMFARLFIHFFFHPKSIFNFDEKT